MLSRMSGENAFLDFRERAPGAAERDMYLDEGGNFVQSQSLIGGKASGIPGTVRGMQAAHDFRTDPACASGDQGDFGWRRTGRLVHAFSSREHGRIVDRVDDWMLQIALSMAMNP